MWSAASGRESCSGICRDRGTLRFDELRRLLPARLTQQALTNQLRELEADGVAHREVYRQVPPKVEYSLNALGRSFGPVLEGLCRWGLDYQARLITPGAGEATASDKAAAV